MMHDQFVELEQRAGGPVKAAALLGVAYHGSYCAYKRSGRMPKYVERSIAAHLALSNVRFNKLLKVSNGGA